MSSPPAAYEPTAPGETTPHWSYLEVCRIAENKRTHEPRTNEQRVKQTHRTLFTRQSTQGQSESKKKLMCATGVWGGGGGGGWYSAGGMVFTADCFKTSPAIIEPVIWSSNAMQMQLHNEDGFKITFLLKIYLSETLTPQNNSRSLSHLWQFHF